MSLRRGITAAEEAKMQKAIAAGAEWPEVLALLEDVEPEYVKEHLFEPMVAAHKAKKSTEPGDSKPGTKKL